MHIPKTSGLGMAALLSRVYRARPDIPVFDGSLFGNFRAFETITPALRAKVDTGDERYRLGEGDFVAGHLSYFTLRTKCPEASLMTVLREPRSRVLSHWVYWRTIPEPELASWGDWGAYVARAREPLKAFLCCPDVACQTDNLITRMLLWKHPSIPLGDFIEERQDEGLIAAARRTLAQFDFVDTIENRHFESNLARWLGKRLPDYPEVNRTPLVPADQRSPLEKELDGETIELLERRTRLDARLWSETVKKLAIEEDSARFASWIFMRNIARFARLMSG